LFHLVLTFSPFCIQSQ